MRARRILGRTTPYFLHPRSNRNLTQRLQIHIERAHENNAGIPQAQCPACKTLKEQIAAQQ